MRTSVLLCLLVLGLVPVPANAADRPLNLEPLADGRLRLAWTNGPTAWVAEASLGLVPDNWQPLA